MASTFTLTSGSYDGRYLQLTCTQTQNIANNASTISWTLTSTGGSKGYYSTGPTKVVINGVIVANIERKSYDSYAFPAAKGSLSGTTTVAHTNNGSKSISVSLSTAIYTATVSTYSGTWVLDNIPRAATLLTAPNFNDEENPTITYTNPSGSAVTALEACIARDDGKVIYAPYRAISTSGTSYTFELTEEERVNLRQGVLEGSDSRRIEFVVRTKIGGQTYWSAQYRQLTIINANPTITPTVVDVNEATLALTDNENTIIKGHSNAAYVFNAETKKHATITAYKVNGATASAAATLEQVETGTFVFSATDNRDITATETITKTLIEYFKPTCKQEAAIDFSGETLATITVNIDGEFYNGSFGAVENTLLLEYRIKVGSGSVFTEWIAITEDSFLWETNIDGNTYHATGTLPDYPYDLSVTIQTRATDKLNVISTNEYVLKLVPVFDWSNNDFNFNVPVSINNVELDYIIEQGETDGWHYRKWNSGIGECWKILTFNSAITQAWGSMYQSEYIPRQNYPMVFIGKPVENVCCVNGGIGGWICPADAANGGTNGAYASAVYTVIRPAAVSSSQTHYINYQVKGSWK